MVASSTYTPRAAVVFAAGCSLFLMSMFFRTSAAVISPQLAAEFGLDSAGLGRLSGAFFYAFAACQIPVGLALDRIGPRITVAILSAVGMIGALVFAFAHSADMALVGRVVLGVGMSGNLMGPMALLAAWFPPNRFATLSGTIVSIGTAGILLSGTPLALLADWLGWRYSFVIMAALNAMLGLTFWLVVRDRPEGAQAPARPKGNPLKGLGQVLSMPSYWMLSFASFMRYGTYMAVQGLWLAPLMMYGLGHDAVEAGHAILIMGVGQMVGLPIFGWMSDRVFASRRMVILPALILQCAFIFCLIWVEHGVSMTWMFIICFGIGAFAAPGQIMYAHMKELADPKLVGTAVTSINIFSMLGPAAMMEAVGWVMMGEPSSFQAAGEFNPAWWLLVGCLAAAAVVYALVPDSRPDED